MPLGILYHNDAQTYHNATMQHKEKLFSSFSQFFASAGKEKLINTVSI